MTDPYNTPSPSSPPAFRGFASPHYTQVPDDLFDELLSLLSGAELKVLLYIIRRTFGFKKTSEQIALRQIRTGITTRDGRVLDRGTGLSLSAAQSAIKALVAKGILIAKRNRSATRGDEATTYRLHLREPGEAGRSGQTPASQGSSPTIPTDGLVGTSKEGIPQIGIGGYRKSVTQETGSQHTENSDRNSKATRQQENPETGPGDDDDPMPNTVALPEAPLAIHRPASPHAHSTRTGSLHTLGDLLAQRGLRTEATIPTAHEVSPHASTSQAQDSLRTTRHRGRIRPTPAIAVAVTDVSETFGDLRHLGANSTQAMRLWQESGRDEASFVGTLYEARSITTHQPRVANRRSYFWIVVRDLLGLRSPAYQNPSSSKNAG